MNCISPLRKRLLSFLSATLLALSAWVIDYVVLPPLWPLLTTSSNFDARYTAAAQVLRHPQLRIGISLDKLPLGAETVNEELVGFKIDLAHELARRWFDDQTSLAVTRAPEETLGQLAPDQVDLTIVSISAPPRNSTRDAWGSRYKQWHYVKLPLMPQPFAIGVRRDDTALVELVSHTLLDMQKDGRYEAIYQRWFGNQVKVEREEEPSVVPQGNGAMVRIPSGPFQRGYHQGRPDERLAQLVHLDEFYIDRYEVTFADYQHCVAGGACAAPRIPKLLQNTQQSTKAVVDKLPVTWVSWRDAEAYCRFVHKRLPTEAEWEKAARGPNAFLYPWGNEPPATQANFALLAGGAASGGAYAGDKSHYGVFDMAGNVREWVADWYQWDYYRGAPKQNPPGPTYGETKVVRGGSWDDAAGQLRASQRANVLPTAAEADLGFRCASTTVPPLP